MNESDNRDVEDGTENEQDSTEDANDNGGDGDGGTAGMGLDPHAEPDDQTKKDIEEERDRRLDPDNRPDGAEIDNTPRDFDVDRGQFTDSESYDESEPAPFSDPEDPNNPDNAAADGPEDSAPKDSGRKDSGTSEKDAS